jgi:hypothetical protein
MYLPLLVWVALPQNGFGKHGADEAAVTFLLGLDYCVHAEQTSAEAAESGQTFAGAGRLGEGWTTSAGAERLSFSVCLPCFSLKNP